MEQVTQKIMDETLVSVVLLCYNHENFIEEALDSVLMQKSVGNFEIIIGEDYSTDNSKEIIHDYIKNYPNRIKLQTSDQNVGLIKNYLRCIKEVKTKYFAVLSCDDYWIDPFKLKKQVDFLEINDDHGLVYTNFSSLNEESGKITTNYLASVKHSLYNGNCRDELIKGIPAIMNITCCYRTKVFSNDFFYFLDDDKIKAEDFPSAMWAGFNYKICYSHDVTSVYRVNKNSITNSMTLNRKWEFALSHIYMREKFLKEKNYTPQNWREIEIGFNRQILDFGFKTYSKKEEVLKAIEVLKKYKNIKIIDYVKYLSINNKFINTFLIAQIFLINGVKKFTRMSAKFILNFLAKIKLLNK